MLFDINNYMDQLATFAVGLKVDVEKFDYSGWEICFPKGVKLKRFIDRTGYFDGDGLSGNITFFLTGDGIIRYSGIYHNQQISTVFIFQKTIPYYNRDGFIIRYCDTSIKN